MTHGYEKTLRGHYLDLTHQGHRDWMRDANPQNWNDLTWRAYNVRMATDQGFSTRAIQAAEDRHRWVEEHLATAIGDRRVSGEVRMEFRRDLMRGAFEKFPRPDPWENGWKLPEHADPISGIGRSPRRASPLRPHSQPENPNDSKGLEAARAVNQARSENAVEEATRRAWS